MRDGFEGVNVLGQRRKKEILEEQEQRLRTRADRRGLDLLDERSLGFELLDQPVGMEDEEDVEKYLDGAKELRTAELVLRGEDGRTERPRQLREDISIHLKFDNDRFLQIYDQATEELDIGSAAFSFVGYGDSAVEAYGEAAPAMAFRLEGDEQTGFTASYRDGRTVIEAIMADDEDDFREIYNTLQDTSAVYRGAVLEGEDKDEWIVSDYGAEDLTEVR